MARFGRRADRKKGASLVRLFCYLEEIFGEKRCTLPVPLEKLPGAGRFFHGKWNSFNVPYIETGNSLSLVENNYLDVFGNAELDYADKYRYLG